MRVTWTPPNSSIATSAPARTTLRTANSQGGRFLAKHTCGSACGWSTGSVWLVALNRHRITTKDARAKGVKTSRTNLRLQPRRSVKPALASVHHQNETATTSSRSVPVANAPNYYRFKPKFRKSGESFRTRDRANAQSLSVNGHHGRDRPSVIWRTRSTSTPSRTSVPPPIQRTSTRSIRVRWPRPKCGCIP